MQEAIDKITELRNKLDARTIETFGHAADRGLNLARLVLNNAIYALEDRDIDTLVSGMLGDMK